MSPAVRVRIVIAEALVALTLIAGTIGAGVASAFISGQVHDQLAPQQIRFPTSAAAGLPNTLTRYAGQQVVNGDQAHAYAEDFIGLHLRESGQNHPYSYWSARAHNKALSATEQAQASKTAETLFKGESLKAMLNQAWTFGVIAEVAHTAMVVLGILSLLALAVVGLELVTLVKATRR